jgi:acyl-homoserine-lactone acylase
VTHRTLATLQGRESRMRLTWMRRRRSTASGEAPRCSTADAKGRRRRWLAAGAAAGVLTCCAPAAAAHMAAAAVVSGPQYEATIVRTAYGIPHITALDFGSLGYGYGFALASDDICTMADGYVTVEAQRSRYFGPNGSDPSSGSSNIDSDTFWQAVIDRQVIPKLLAIQTGPGAIGLQLRQLISGYVAGYNRYLASVGGAGGISDPTCRGKAWVKPITTLGAYLLIYQTVDQRGQAGTIPGITEAQPPPNTTTAAGRSADIADSSAATPVAPKALSVRTASVVHTPPGANGLPSIQQLRNLGEQLSAASQGSNAIAVGSAGTRDHQHGMLLGNPHYPWSGIDRFYEVQFTIPGTMNVEGATIYGIPLVVIGFTSTMAWSLTVSTTYAMTPYQLTLVPGDPTQYIYDGKPAAMTSETVTVDQTTAAGITQPVKRTLWSTRWGPVTSMVMGHPFPWNTQTAFALADANADNFRILNNFLATDEAGTTAQELSILGKYQGLPWVNMVASDSNGNALYADIGSFPNVTDAEAAACDTALGAVSFQQIGLPILDGSRSACAWATDKDSAVPGIFGPSEEPSLMTKTFVENSNNSYWMANPSHPLTDFPRIMGLTGTDLGLRARSALTMVMQRISGSDGLGPAGFTFQDMKNLMFSDIQYGASLVKSQLVAMCQSFANGMAPTSAGGTISVGDSCSVLAAWDGRENIDSRGAVLFRDFWENTFGIPNGPWSQPFDPTDPLHTPNGLATANSQVQQAFGDALSDLTAAHLPYNVALGTVQYLVRNGNNIPLPGGPGDPDGEFNAIYQDVLNQPGVDPSAGSSYIQDVTWGAGDSCPEAAMLLTYSESDNPTSPHYADQTQLFSHSQWVTADFCQAQVTAHAASTTVLHSP